MKLITHWRRAWKFFSVQVGMVAVGFGMLSTEHQLAILSALNLTPMDLPAVVGVAFIVARMVRQDDVYEDNGPLR